MRFEVSEGKKIQDKKSVKVKRMNHLVEVVSIQNVINGLNNVRKISKSEYMLKDTGEVFEYKMSETRANNISGLKDTFRKIRELINNNYTGSPSEIHLTLTYAENMTDSKRLYLDFDRFWKRFKRKFGKDFDYISIVEPQGRGAWHHHVLIKRTDGKRLYIPSKQIEDIWQQGFVKIKTLYGVDNIGAYLSAYLGDIEVPEDEVTFQTQTIKEVQVEGSKKKFIKGGRLHLYPPGMNIFRHSKNIKYPEVEEMQYKDIKNIVRSAIPNYTKTITIYDDDNIKVLNVITYEQYNIKRMRCEGEI